MNNKILTYSAITIVALLSIFLGLSRSLFPVNERNTNLYLGQQSPNAEKLISIFTAADSVQLTAIKDVEVNIQILNVTDSIMQISKYAKLNYKSHKADFTIDLEQVKNGAIIVIEEEDKCDIDYFDLGHFNIKLGKQEKYTYSVNPFLCIGNVKERGEYFVRVNYFPNGGNTAIQSNTIKITVI